MTDTDIQKIRQLLKEANICKIIPGTVIIEAEIYNQVLALLPCESCGGTLQIYKLFDRCPECGCEDSIRNDTIGENYRQCAKCGQNWWTNIKYGIPCPDCQS